MKSGVGGCCVVALISGDDGLRFATRRAQGLKSRAVVDLEVSTFPAANLLWLSTLPNSVALTASQIKSNLDDINPSRNYL